MQTTIASVTRPTAVPPSPNRCFDRRQRRSVGSYNLIRRNGSVVGFEPSKIAIAMTRPSWPSMAARARLRACASWSNR